MNLGYLFAALATFSFAVAVFPYTFLHHYASTKVVSFWRLCIATFLVLIVALLLESSTFIQIFNTNYSSAWLWIGLSGIITFVIGDFLIIQSFATLGAAKGSLLTSLSPAMALLFGVLLLGEKMNFIGIIGIFITILGIIIVNLKSNTNNDHNNKAANYKAIVFGILGACCLGIGIALSKKGAIETQSQGLSISPLSVSFIRIGVAFVVFAIIYFVIEGFKQLTAIFKSSKGTKLLLYGSFLNPTTGIVFSMYSIAYIDVAIAQTFFSTAPLFSILISVFYFKEKLQKQTIIGALVAVVGVLLLIFRDQLL
jgi:drug/metabolite transporter (DMT)-like permease